jgi:hypothetical protein
MSHEQFGKKLYLSVPPYSNQNIENQQTNINTQPLHPGGTKWNKHKKSHINTRIGMYLSKSFKNIFLL